MCDHKFIFLSRSKKCKSSDYNLHYIMIERFYCEKCLEEKEIKKEEYGRQQPDWYGAS